MAAPKQKWTSEEEGALKAGIDKYGPGKWRAIIKDPEFGHHLKARSNVDLKDKSRNLNRVSISKKLKMPKLTISKKPKVTINEIVDKDSSGELSQEVAALIAKGEAAFAFAEVAAREAEKAKGALKSLQRFTAMAQSYMTKNSR